MKTAWREKSITSASCARIGKDRQAHGTLGIGSWCLTWVSFLIIVLRLKWSL